MKMKTLIAATVLALTACASRTPRQAESPPPTTGPETGMQQPAGTAPAAGAQAQGTQQAAPPPPAGQQPPSEQGMPMRWGMMGQKMAGMCPMQVQGTTARAEEMEGGMAIVFETTGDVAEVRRRVAQMAEMHNRHQSGARGHGMHGARGGPGTAQRASPEEGTAPPGRMQQGGTMRHGGMRKGMKGQGMMMPASTARAEDVEGGARLVFMAEDTEQMTTLRQSVAQHAEQMSSGHCPMMWPEGEPAREPVSGSGEESEEP